jgi:hypothetical protein
MSAPWSKPLTWAAEEPLIVHPDGRTRCDGCDDPVHDKELWQRFEQEAQP